MGTNRQHLRAYLAEFAGTGIMMAVGVTGVVLFWAPGSPVPAIANVRLRLLVTALAFAGSATAVVYSPLGQISGGHLNPAVTCAFWRLRRIASRDAIAYAIAQTLGALVGVLAVLLAFGSRGRAVDLGMTRPAAGLSSAAAFGYETAITFALVFLILNCLNWPRVAPRTGILAGVLVTVLVVLESPLTGASVNPARSAAPALVMLNLGGLWIYVVAPLLGAVIAAAVWRGRWGARQSLICAKLYHGGACPCHFPGCPYVAYDAHDAIVREGDPGDSAFIIEAGEVEVRRTSPSGELLLGRLGAGDWFGEMSVLLGEARSATVVAVTDVRARRLTREGFDQALADDPARARALLKQLATRLRDTDQRLAART